MNINKYKLVFLGVFLIIFTNLQSLNSLNYSKNVNDYLFVLLIEKSDNKFLVVKFNIGCLKRSSLNNLSLNGFNDNQIIKVEKDIFEKIIFTGKLLTHKYCDDNSGKRLCFFDLPDGQNLTYSFEIETSDKVQGRIILKSQLQEILEPGEFDLSNIDLDDLDILYNDEENKKPRIRRYLEQSGIGGYLLGKYLNLGNYYNILKSKIVNLRK